MSELASILIRSGIIQSQMIEEMKRWGMPIDGEAPGPFQAEVDIKRLCETLEEVVQSEGRLIVRETDLSAIPQYLRTMQAAVLHVRMEDGALVPFDTQVGVSASGEYIIPWRSDSITDLMTNGETYLSINGQKIFFSGCRELFYGTNKAFIICTPSTKEPDAHRT